MEILSFRARGWRNLDEATWKPRNRVTVLWGENGQGKTNVVEAIYYLATLRSWRTADASDLVRHGATTAELAAEARAGGLTRAVQLELGGGRRRVRIDGKQVRGAAAILGAFAAVLFVPEHLGLPRGAPAGRRRFLDLVVFALHRGYYREAGDFQRALKSRNAALRGGVLDGAELDAWDEMVARTGARVVVRRREVALALAPLLQQRFADVMGEQAGIAAALAYRSHQEIAAAADESGVRDALVAGLASRRQVDLRRRMTLFGPHTDDVDLLVGDRPAREHASQGQTRALVLALKLAEVGLLTAHFGEAPLLLLDDVASELDASRRAHLFAAVSHLSGQAFITTTDRALVPALPDRVDERVRAGHIGDA